MGGAFALALSGSLDCTPDSGPPILSGTLNGGYCFLSSTCAPDAGLNVTGRVNAVYTNMPPALSGLNDVVDGGGLSVCANSGDGGCVFAGAMGGTGWQASLDAGAQDCSGF
jgi:hypothetical protein